MTDYKPYKDREEHRYVNKMTVIIARLRLAIKAGEQAIDDLQEETEDHIETFLKRRRGSDKEK